MEGSKVVGIRREEKNKWERRCSITPNEVQYLISVGIKVLVQPSNTRCYTTQDFLDAGATIQEDLSCCDVIFGVKEVPMELLIPGKTYFFFSHTIKAQAYNMPLLDVLLERKIRMIDFECIRENKQENPQRLVAFGKYAGIAGAFDFLRGIGEFMLQKLHSTGFIFLGSSYMYEDYSLMKEALARVATNIAKNGLPKEFSPLVFGVTGTGRVAQGIMEVLTQLPHVLVDPDDLATLSLPDTKKVVIAQFTSAHLVRHSEGKPFSKQDYYTNSSKYESKFCDYLPYVHFLVHGIYWEAKYPRVLTIEELRSATQNKKSKLLGICDISADFQGSIEFTSRFTNIEDPFLLYDAIKGQFYEKIAEANENCILFHSVDHLPAEMPKEASNYFGSQLKPFLKDLVFSNPALPFEDMADLPPEIKNAIICCHGALTPNYHYIGELRKANEYAQKELEQYAITMQENKRKSSSVKRGLSSVTIVLTGDLIQTRFFNECVDIMVKNETNFRIIEWEVVGGQLKGSSVTVQIVAKDNATMDRVIDIIEEAAQKQNIKVNEGQGPAFEEEMVKQIHQDRVR